MTAETVVSWLERPDSGNGYLLVHLTVGMSTFEKEYETTVGSAREYLARADDLDGFLFAAAEGEDLNATIGRNDASQNTLWLDQLLGVLILGIANTHDVHPAEVGHMAIEFAMEHMDG